MDGPRSRDSSNNSVRNTVQPLKRSDESIDKLRESLKRQRSQIVLWRSPVSTVTYFILEIFEELKRLIHGVLQHRIKVSLAVFILTLMLLSYYIDGPHQSVVIEVEALLLWYGYWVGLGILSSVGLGTGLHTFILYLGPHIASVSLAAWTCGSVDFPQPPYPNDIICPDSESPYPITLWTIMSKVRMEAFMWGIGTAIGELPPYFMARAARLSGDEHGEDYDELEAVIHSHKKDPITRAKKAVHRLIQRVGFFGILLCASIPNPLFDLAGITCGHFLVPFWTFFGATTLGKAVIKMHIQKLFVVLAFSKNHVEWAVDSIGLIPYVGKYLMKPFSEYLETQKTKLHNKPGSTPAHSTSMLQFIFGQVLLAMIAYFIVSIVNSMAQQYVKRKHENMLHEKSKET